LKFVLLKEFGKMKPLQFIEEQDIMEQFVRDLFQENLIENAKVQLRRKYKIQPSNANILYTYKRMVEEGKIPESHEFLEKCKGHSNRENSGVIVISLVMSPNPEGQAFSCKYDCSYCPNEPAHAGNNFVPQPRSYLHNEPGVLRANRNNFSAIAQMHDRMSAYSVNGLPVDKIEVIILGGTWSSYPESYVRQFILDIFIAANIFKQQQNQTIQEIQQNQQNQIIQDIEDINSWGPEAPNLVIEQGKNEKSGDCRIIGITIETRPDQINEQQLKLFRELGVTRVQIGVQHTDDKILKGVNRQCSTRHTIKAIRMLKDNCFKVDIHLMPDLPGASPEIDREMFDNVLQNPDLQADQWKIYPCTIVPWTAIEQQYRSGAYVPYGFEALKELLIYVKSAVHPWIRLNRIIRDIPSTYFTTESEMKPNLRQLLQKEMKARGLACRCIRCREIKNGDISKQSELQLIVRTYVASGGTEYFISYESTNNSKNDSMLYGFCRLRIGGEGYVFDELAGCGLIRELHVYGKVIGRVQHKGLGTQLLEKAEEITAMHNLSKVAVISGVGVRDYYRKRGFTLIEPYGFMIKKIENVNIISSINMQKEHILLLLIIFMIVGVTYLITQIGDPLLRLYCTLIFYPTILILYDMNT